MTNYDTMPAGRELDALVAEKVMGLTAWCSIQYHTNYISYKMSGCGKCGKPVLPSYSTDIATAWQVIDALHRRGFKFLMGDNSSMTVRPGQQHSCRIYLQPLPGYKARVLGTARADSMTLAICRAALMAVQA